MAQQYTATLYKNTGFNSVDIPDSPALVKSFASVNASALYNKQNAPLERVRIQKSFDDIKNCDYLELGNMFYFITDIRMLNDNVCELGIVEDSLTSLGGASKLKFIDGWCERRHVTTDYIFDNVIPENFTPKEPLQLDMYSCGHLSDYTNSRVFVASTVDLSDPSWSDADIYVGQASGNNYRVTVPAIPDRAHSTTIEIMPIAGTSSYLSATTPGYGLYDYNNANVEAAIKKIRALGLETVLVGCYRIPLFLIDNVVDNGGYIQTLTMKDWDIGFQKVDDQITGATTGTLKYRYGNYTPANNKVYSVYNDVTVYSLSGDRMTYKMCDIKDANNLVNPDAGPGFKLVSNGAPEGKPYLRPQYIEGQAANHITVFDNAVAGSQWLNTPLRLTGASGSALIGARGTIVQQAAQMNWDANTYKWREKHFYDMMTMGGQVLDTGVSVLGANNMTAKDYMAANGGRYDAGGVGMGNTGIGFASFANLYGNVMTADPAAAQRRINLLANEIMGQKLAYEISQNIVAPDVKFNQDMTLQMFLGNAFFAYTARLSDTDLERFDKYLTLYGYATSEPLTTACFSGRVNYNFVQASGVSIEGTSDTTYAENNNRARRVLAAAQLSAGVRVWHTAPNTANRFVNPMTT